MASAKFGSTRTSTSPKTTDEQQARAHAARHRLVVLANSYEFVTSAPVADFTAAPVSIAHT
jgi:hypothetical protein